MLLLSRLASKSLRSPLSRRHEARVPQEQEIPTGHLNRPSLEAAQLTADPQNRHGAAPFPGRALLERRARSHRCMESRDQWPYSGGENGAKAVTTS